MGFAAARRFGQNSKTPNEVWEVTLVKGENAALGDDEGLKTEVGEGERDADVTNFEGVIGQLEAVVDGVGGSSQVAEEPVDGSATGVERHLTQSGRRESKGGKLR